MEHIYPKQPRERNNRFSKLVERLRKTLEDTGVPPTYIEARPGYLRFKQAVRIPAEPKLDGKNQKQITLHLRHRSAHRQRLAKALSSGSDVLWLTVMSSSTHAALSALLNAKAPATVLRVLTWHPKMPKAVVEAFRMHLDEFPGPRGTRRASQQIKRAAEDWDFLKTKYGLQVKQYRSSPTMQGFLVGGPDGWGLIELFPYSVQPEDRPALVFTLKNEPEIFELFRKAFDRLWKDAGD